MSSSNHRPSFVLTRLYRKKSEKGTTYFTGRFGASRVALVKSSEVADDSGEISNLLMSEAPAKRNTDAGQRQQDHPSKRAWPTSRASAQLQIRRRRRHVVVRPASAAQPGEAQALTQGQNN